jgi:tetratricopeptide (TPR) repeat protein
MAVYSYGAVVLPAIDPAEAIKIAEKGIANNPSEWRLYQQLGYIYWRLGNFEKASEVYDQGAMIQGAAPFMKMMSARMRSEGGSRETARAIYRQMLEESADKQLQENAALRLLELDSRDDMDAIQKALEEFKTQNGRCANSLRELRPLLVRAVLPEQRQFRVNESNELVDPTGAPYQLDSKTCNVSLDKKNTKLPIS